MKRESARSSSVSQRLASAMVELRSLQKLLPSGDLDPYVLSDFRVALNRIRNTAWVAQQFAASKVSGAGSAGVASLLLSERIRAAYQLCRAIQEDLGRKDIQFQRGQLSELYAAATQLAEQLKQKGIVD